MEPIMNSWSLEQIFDQIQHWTAGIQDRWYGTTITFSFAVSGGQIRDVLNDDGETLLSDGFVPVPSTRFQPLIDALALWDDLISPSIVPKNGNSSSPLADPSDIYTTADIEIAMSATMESDVLGETWHPSESGGVWFNATLYNDDKAVTGSELYAFIHELGHALGLDHAG